MYPPFMYFTRRRTIPSIARCFPKGKSSSVNIVDKNSRRQIKSLSNPAEKLYDEIAGAADKKKLQIRTIIEKRIIKIDRGKDEC